jgi:hypothetical protein
MVHHVWYLLSFPRIVVVAVIVPTDGGLDVGACAVGGRANLTFRGGTSHPKGGNARKETFL